MLGWFAHLNFGLICKTMLTKRSYFYDDSNGLLILALRENNFFSLIFINTLTLKVACTCSKTKSQINQVAPTLELYTSPNGIIVIPICVYMFVGGFGGNDVVS